MLALLCSFQGPWRRRRPDWPPVSQNSTACRRLASEAPCPSSVDMLGAGAARDLRYADLATRPLQSWSSLERRGPSRTFRYGYLVPTSPQSRAPPSTAPSLAG